MLKFQANKFLIVVSIAAFVSPFVSATSVVDSYHNDFRNSLKIDFKSDSGFKSSLTGEQLAKQFLRDNKQLYGIENIFDNLNLSKVKSSLLGDHYYFQQFINDIPVEKGEIIVSVSKTNSVMRVFNNTFPQKYTSTTSHKYEINSGTAEELVWDYLQASGNLHFLPESNLVYINRLGKFTLAVKVNMIVSAPFGSWEFYVDATTSEILEAYRIDLPLTKNANAGIKDRKWPKFPINAKHTTYSRALLSLQNKSKQPRLNSSNKVDATALVFDPDPVTTLSDESLEDGSASSSFDAAYVSRTLKDITLDNGVYSLVGPWVSIVDIDGELPATPPSTTTDGNWTAKRGDNAFNDAMTYFHIDQNQRYIQSLGFTGAKGIQDNSMQVDTDGVNGDDNSQFVYGGGNQYLSFGHGCVDDNEDIDVILHEYAHAMIYSINTNFDGADTGAMGEGFGDYWAASYSYSTPNGLSFRPEWAFSWDGHNLCWDGRRLDRTSYRYNPNQSYGAHVLVDGQNGDEIWSTPLTQSLIQLLNDGVNRNEVDQIIWEAQFGLGSGVTMRDMAASIVTTATSLFPNGPHAQIFENNFKMMNILENTENDAPVATVANSSIAALEGADVSMDASLSSDSDGDSLTYTWSQTAGPSVALSSTTNSTTGFTAPSVSASTTFLFTVTVSDPDGASDIASITVIVTPLPQVDGDDGGGGGGFGWYALILLGLFRKKN